MRGWEENTHIHNIYLLKPSKGRQKVAYDSERKQCFNNLQSNRREDQINVMLAETLSMP